MTSDDRGSSFRRNDLPRLGSFRREMMGAGRGGESNEPGGQGRSGAPPGAPCGALLVRPPLGEGFDVERFTARTWSESLPFVSSARRDREGRHPRDAGFGGRERLGSFRAEVLVSWEARRGVGPDRVVSCRVTGFIRIGLSKSAAGPRSGLLLLRSTDGKRSGAATGLHPLPSRKSPAPVTNAPGNCVMVAARRWAINPAGGWHARSEGSEPGRGSPPPLPPPPPGRTGPSSLPRRGRRR